MLFFGLCLTSRAMIGLGLGGLLHMLMDTIVGNISWGIGRFSVSGPIVTVPAIQDHWILSFLFHWTFLIELCVCFSAGLLLLSRRNRRDSE